VTFPTPSGPYESHNYDEKFEATITLRRALAQSRNIPALKLANSLGIQTVIDYAHRFGITSNIPPYLPVAPGAVEVTPMEQTSALSVFPNDKALKDQFPNVMIFGPVHYGFQGIYNWRNCLAP